MQSKVLELRKARESDAEQLLAWQADLSTRRYFRNPKAPTPQEHFAWFLRTLIDPNCQLLFLIEGETSVGAVRLDGPDKRNHWEVSIVVAPECRGRGIGTAALQLVRCRYNDRYLVAEVLPGNDASRSAFLKAGFIHNDDRGKYIAAPGRKGEND